MAKGAQDARSVEVGAFVRTESGVTNAKGASRYPLKQQGGKRSTYYLREIRYFDMIPMIIFLL